MDEHSEIIQVNCNPIDKALKGGFRKGTINHIYGESSTGKTNLLASLAVNSLSNSQEVVLISKEDTTFDRVVDIITNKYKEESEELLARLYTKKVTSFEQQEQTIDELRDILPVDLILVDGIGGLYRLKRGESNNPEEIERKFLRQISLLKSYARKYNIPIIITNQVYTNTETDTVEPLGSAGMGAWFDSIGYLESFDNSKHSLVIQKSRYGGEGERAWFQITNNGVEKIHM